MLTAYYDTQKLGLITDDALISACLDLGGGGVVYRCIIQSAYAKFA